MNTNPNAKYITNSRTLQQPPAKSASNGNLRIHTHTHRERKSNRSVCAEWSRSKAATLTDRCFFCCFSNLSIYQLINVVIVTLFTILSCSLFTYNNAPNMQQLKRGHHHRYDTPRVIAMRLTSLNRRQSEIERRAERCTQALDRCVNPCTSAVVSRLLQSIKTTTQKTIIKIANQSKSQIPPSSSSIHRVNVVDPPINKRAIAPHGAPEKQPGVCGAIAKQSNLKTNLPHNIPLYRYTYIQ